MKRAEIAEQSKWDLTHVFKSLDDWTSLYNEVKEDLKIFDSFKGKLGDIEKLRECLKLKYELNANTDLLLLYAYLQADEDTRISENQALFAKVAQLEAESNSAVSFMQPELLKIGDKLLDFANEDGLQIYKNYFHNILRGKKHLLSHKEEKLLATLGELEWSYPTLHKIITNAEITFEDVLDSKGNKHKLTYGTYIKYRESEDRVLRKNAVYNFLNKFVERKDSLAQNFIEFAKKEKIYAKVRNYNSSIEAKLDVDNIPVEIYHNLIDVVFDNLAPMHKFTEICKTKLGIDKLYSYDLDVPLIKDVDITITYEEASKKVLAALKPLGQEYYAAVEDGLKNRWVDVYENEGKRSGAYSFAVQGAHPYILMNFSNSIYDMFTLAHEFGHAIHSHLSNKYQPNISSGFTIFTTEVAATLNELLLHEHLMKTTTDPKQRIYLLCKRIDNFRGTLFRQTTFAAFERKAHELIKEGKANLDTLSQAFLELIKKEAGPLVNFPENAEYAWVRIPHFYTSFYVYQYATSFCASIAIYDMIKKEGQPAVDKYINMLKSGKSNYSVDLLKDCGVDLTTKEPIEAAMRNFAELVEQLEVELKGLEG